MKIRRMTDNDRRKIQAYERMTGAVVGNIGGDNWKIETPEQDIYFYSLRDLMIDIGENLAAMRELVEAGQIEPKLWKGAWA